VTDNQWVIRLLHLTAFQAEKDITQPTNTKAGLKVFPLLCHPLVKSTKMDTELRVDCPPCHSKAFSPSNKQRRRSHKSKASYRICVIAGCDLWALSSRVCEAPTCALMTSRRRESAASTRPAYMAVGKTGSPRNNPISQAETCSPGKRASFALR
jgi:hypothetical protein